MSSSNTTPKTILKNKSKYFKLPPIPELASINKKILKMNDDESIIEPSVTNDAESRSQIRKSRPLHYAPSHSRTKSTTSESTNPHKMLGNLNNKVNSVVTNSSDLQMSKYLDQTSQWRDLRKKLNLPELKYEYLTYMHGSLSSQVNSIRFLTTLNQILSSKYATEIGGDELGPRYEPTYQLTPHEDFKYSKIEFTMKNVLRNFVENMLEPETLLSKSSTKAVIEHLTTTIKNCVKPLVDKRYKLVVYTAICQLAQQDLFVASTCLWDSQNDRCVSIRDTFKNHVIIVNFYAVYKE
jgi:hypothetical protein